MRRLPRITLGVAAGMAIGFAVGIPVALLVRRPAAPAPQSPSPTPGPVRAPAAEPEVLPVEPRGRPRVHRVLAEMHQAITEGRAFRMPSGFELSAEAARLEDDGTVVLSSPSGGRGAVLTFRPVPASAPSADGGQPQMRLAARQMTIRVADDAILRIEYSEYDLTAPGTRRAGALDSVEIPLPEVPSREPVAPPGR